MKGIVDRFEGNIVVIEIKGKTQNFSKEQVDPKVKEGDVVRLQDGIWRTDHDKTKSRIEKIKTLMDDLWVD